LTALPARHDLWRRRTCGWLARKVDAGFIAEEDAHRLAHELAYNLVRRAYKL
jgi:glucuronate isomerase